MNVFEDLIIELKQENLLENTVMDNADNKSVRAATDDSVLDSEIFEVHDEQDPEHDGREAAEPSTTGSGSFGLTDVARPMPNGPEPGAAESADLQLQGSNETIEIRKPDTEREFFQKRAIGEISSLQMVEAVLSAVERERMKIVPKSYDDLEAKKALHFFLHVAEDENSEQHKQAEYDLMRETEAWCSALAARDREITVANIRRYCENCRPMLSSQAMLAMARFYRNLPCSESVRGKFDFIITRLFSRPLDEEDKRMLLFTRDEMLGHIKTLYADWSSISLYAVDQDESNILLTAMSFEDLASEAESAKNFDELIKSDFFGRLRLFKESIAELFFAPNVTAAAIECNIRIGNIYVDLIDRERRSSDPATVHQKYGDLDDQTVSEAAGRTLELVEILRERSKPVVVDESEPETEHIHEEHIEKPSIHSEEPLIAAVSSPNMLVARLKAQAFAVNRWFLALSVLLIAASVGIYIWGNYFAEPKISNAGVKTLSFQGTELGDIVKTAKLSGDTLYIVAQPTYDSLAKEKQTELLQKLYQSGNEKGWVNVNLMNSEGKTVGFASPSRFDLISPEK
ncbi:MAG: hypothetical protein KA746_06060 [Pyrinomonadaceae bacterium]|nr:hypothetical protein [Pyrinomonadaceae bacterium]